MGPKNAVVTKTVNQPGTLGEECRTDLPVGLEEAQGAERELGGYRGGQQQKEDQRQGKSRFPARSSREGPIGKSGMAHQ
jgi:hypothetical protein